MGVFQTGTLNPEPLNLGYTKVRSSKDEINKNVDDAMRVLKTSRPAKFTDEAGKGHWRQGVQVSLIDLSSNILTILVFAFCPLTHIIIRKDRGSCRSKSATTSRAGGMRMAPGRGRCHLCWWPLIFKKNFLISILSDLSVLMTT